MLEVIINRVEVNFTTKNRIYTEYYAEKKTNANLCPKKCVTLSRLSCLITAKENHPFWLHLVLARLGHLFSTSEITSLAKDHR